MTAFGSRPPRWHVAIALCVLLAAAATGCGDGDPEAGGDRWPSATSPIDTQGLVWAAGSQVHLPDDSTIDAGSALGGYVVSSAGVWFLDGEATQTTEAGSDRPPALRLARPDGELVDIDAHPMASTVTVSADGRWLAFLDQPEGAPGPAEAVVVDTVEGTEVVRSREGLEPEVAGTDWTDLYEELPVDVIAVTDDTAYIRGLHDTLAFDLSTGKASVVEAPEPSPPPRWNPAHTWSIPKAAATGPAKLQRGDGSLLTTRFATEPGAPPPLDGSPDLESWTLIDWLNDVTAAGLTRTRGEFDTLPVLVTCSVPGGDCEVVPGTEQGVNLPLDRPAGLPRTLD